MKEWIVARIAALKEMVTDACAQNSYCSRTQSACRLASEASRARLCAGVSDPTACVQGSVGATCVEDPEPCAANPCGRDQTCKTTVVAVPCSADACGCAGGQGWGSAGCEDGKSTSRTEAIACARWSGTQSSWLSFTCEDGGEEPAPVGPDACGCDSSTSGWSKNAMPPHCVAGATTTPDEAATCARGGIPGPGAGSGSAPPPPPPPSSSGGCDVVTLATLTADSCPRAAPGSFTPSSCPTDCARVFVPWWESCGSRSEFTSELRFSLSSTAPADFGRFAAMCRGAESPAPAPPLAHNGFVCTLDALAGLINVICPAVGQAVRPSRPSRDALISAMTSLSGDSSLSAGTGCGAGLTVWIDECGDEVAARPPAAAQQNGVNCIDSPQGCSAAAGAARATRRVTRSCGKPCPRWRTTSGLALVIE